MPSRKLKTYKTDTSLYRNLETLLNLPSSGAEEFPLLGGIQLTIDTLPLLTIPHTRADTKTLNVAGWFNGIHQVPTDKRWIVYAIDITDDGAGNTWSNVAFRDYTTNGCRFIVDSSAGKNEYRKFFEHPIIMQYDGIREWNIECDAHVGDTVLTMDIYYIEMDRIQP